MLSALPPARLCRLYTEPSGATRSTTRSPIHVCTMCTSTVAVAEPLLFEQPAMLIGEVTAAPASGIATSVPLVPVHEAGGGGGGVGPLPTISSAFGEPLPGLVILPAVALAFSAACTVAGEAVGLAAR